MNKPKCERTLLGVLAFTIIGTSCVAFLATILFLKIAWPHVIPSIAPGAVERGLLVENIGWTDAFKVSLVVAIWTGITRDAITQSVERWMSQDSSSEER